MKSFDKAETELTTGQIIVGGKSLDIETTNDLNMSGEELELPQANPGAEVHLPLWKVGLILLVALLLIGLTFLLVKVNIKEIGPESNSDESQGKNIDDSKNQENIPFRKPNDIKKQQNSEGKPNDAHSTDPLQVDEPSKPKPVKSNKSNELTFSYPTLGMPQPNSTFNSESVTPKQYYTYEYPQYDLFKPYSEHDCRLERYGDANKGGFVVCANFLDKVDGLINVGIEEQDQFGCRLVKNTEITNYQYGCDSVDPPKCQDGKNIYFKSCVDERSHNTTKHNYLSLKDIIDNNKLTNKHLILKIDADQAEWKALRTLPVDYLKHIDQITMVVHNPDGRVKKSADWGNVHIVEALDQHFVSVFFHVSPQSCYPQSEIAEGEQDQSGHKLPGSLLEVTLINRHLITLDSQRRSYAPLPYAKLYGETKCQAKDDSQDEDEDEDSQFDESEDWQGDNR